MKVSTNHLIWKATTGNRRFRVGQNIYEPVFRMFGIVIYRKVKSFVESN